MDNARRFACSCNQCLHLSDTTIPEQLVDAPRGRARASLRLRAGWSEGVTQSDGDKISVDDNILHIRHSVLPVDPHIVCFAHEA